MSNCPLTPEDAKRYQATSGRYTLDTVTTLGACLRRAMRIRPTPVLYLSLGARAWLDGQQASDLVEECRSLELSWDAYLDEGDGPDAAGIYLFGADGRAYRGFDVELLPDRRGERP